MRSGRSSSLSWQHGVARAGVRLETTAGFWTQSFGLRGPVRRGGTCPTSSATGTRQARLELSWLRAARNSPDLDQICPRGLEVSDYAGSVLFSLRLGA